jgi:hypothetical protein
MREGMNFLWCSYWKTWSQSFPEMMDFMLSAMIIAL